MQQILHAGFNSFSNLKSILEKLSPKKIFLVTGKKSFSNSGAEKKINNLLTNINFIRFCDFEVNTKVKDINNGIVLLNNEECDVVLGIGGGSVLDMAKATSILATQNIQNCETYLQSKTELRNRSIPLILIPTTAGTGSESTHFPLFI